jgi:pyruvate formate-lyase/glycerol dehydratase family glycyl radical enzyme
MNKRVKLLRKQSLEAFPHISAERAELLTDFVQDRKVESFSIPVQRAMVFKHILSKKKICINPGELIVGERGPAPKASPTYPEICIHSDEDLDILNSREKVPFRVDANVRKIYNDRIIPYWKGRSIRDKIFSEMDGAWKSAYRSGVFTEFQEQRAPGHTVLGNKIYRTGFDDLKKQIATRIENLDFENDPLAFDRREELRAMDISADALIGFARRHARELKRLAGNETDPRRKIELKQMVEICHRIPAQAPRGFWEALQYYWFVHVGVITELNPWDSFNPGRLDQHLYPFYQQDIKSGILTRERARELLQAFWVKFNNHPAPPKVGVTAQESNTYTDFCLINLGGLTEDGGDAVNELTYLILDVIQEMRILQPSSMIQVSKKSPDLLIKRALEIIKTGFGQPSIFNTDAIIQELVRQGKSIQDARNGGASGCVETGAFGHEAYILTGYFNLPKILEITLNNGVDPRIKEKVGIETGDPESFSRFFDLFDAFKRQLGHFIDIKIRGNKIIERIYSKYMPVPFLSLLIDDCIENGCDYNGGGARYNTSYIQGVGLGSVTDSLASLKYNVFDRKRVNMKEMLEALEDNFKGHEKLYRWLIQDTPKYGNDDDYADDIMKLIFEAYFQFVDGRPTTKNGHFRINLLPTTVHVYFGSVINALPDGRKAGEPLSEGISPVQGVDLKGPTAVMKSAGKMDHVRTGGTLLNMKFTPQLLSDEPGMEKLTRLIRSYFRMDGHHVQFNVVSAKILKEAQKNPQKYRNLIVRVAGYSDYFVDLTTELQDEIIKRTEHQTI